MSIPNWQGVHNFYNYQFSVYEECNNDTYSYVGTIFLDGQKIDTITDQASGTDCFNACKKIILSHKS